MPSLSLTPDGGVQDATGAPWAITLAGTLLGGLETIPAPAKAPRLIVRPGFIPDEDAPAEPDPRTWSLKGWDALDAALQDLLGRTGARVLLRPAATDVISDAPSCLRFLERRARFGTDGPARLGLFVDPVGMLAPSMLPTAPEHLERIVAHLAGHDGVDALLIRETTGVATGTLAALVSTLAPGVTTIVQA